MFWLNKQKGKESEKEIYTFFEKLYQSFASQKKKQYERPFRVRAADTWPVSQLLETNRCRPRSLWAVRAAKTSSSFSTILYAKLRRDWLPLWTEIHRYQHSFSVRLHYLMQWSKNKKDRSSFSYIHLCYFRSAEKLSPWVLKAAG